jgi:hypothetical protein
VSCADREWKLYRKCGAFSALRRPIDPSAMFVDDLLRMRETEPSPIGLGCEEWNEKIPSFFLSHAMAAVADRY